MLVTGIIALAAHMAFGTRFARKCERYADRLCKKTEKMLAKERKAAELKAKGELVEHGCKED